MTNDGSVGSYKITPFPNLYSPTRFAKMETCQTLLCIRNNLVAGKDVVTFALIIFKIWNARTYLNCSFDKVVNIWTGITCAVILKPETFPTVLLRAAVCGQCISLSDSRKDTTLETDYTGWEVREACAMSMLSERCVFFSDSLLERQRSWRRRRRGHLKLMWKPSRFTWRILSVVQWPYNWDAKWLGMAKHMETNGDIMVHLGAPCKFWHPKYYLIKVLMPGIWIVASPLFL